MRRDLDDALRWVDQGTQLFRKALDELSDDELDVPTALPGWTGRHLTAHVAGNAEALLNLTHWAATGEETPMYSSPEQRNADIAAGAQRPAGELRQWVADSANRLGAALANLTAEQWDRPVRTAQGRTVPGREIPWLRAREVMVHAVDLDAVVDFTDLPEDFCLALIDDVVAKRSAAGGPALTVVVSGGAERWAVFAGDDPVEVSGPVSSLAAYLTGRGSAGVSTADGRLVPTLPPWL